MSTTTKQQKTSTHRLRKWGGKQYPVIIRLKHDTFDLIAHPNGPAITDGDYLGTFTTYEDDTLEMLEVKRLAQDAFAAYAWSFLRGEFYPVSTQPTESEQANIGIRGEET